MSSTYVFMTQNVHNKEQRAPNIHITENEGQGAPNITEYEEQGAPNIN